MKILYSQLFFILTIVVSGVLGSAAQEVLKGVLQEVLRDPTEQVDFSAYPWKALKGPQTPEGHVLVSTLGYNMQRDILLGASKLGLFTSQEILTLSLEDLKLHGVIEHDASLSREDFALGDNWHFNETIFSTLADSNTGSDVYDTTSAGQVQHARLEDSNKRNPNVTNSRTQLIIRSGESAFYLSVMGDPVRGVAPKKFVQIFFRGERLPIEEGQKIIAASDWQPSGNTCSGIELFPPRGSRLYV